MPFSFFPHMRYRRLIAHCYWFLLTCELLLPNPWVIFGRGVAAHPPVDTSSDASSGFLHLGAFCVLALLLLWSRYPFRAHMKSVIGLAALFAGVSELTQHFIPLRSCSLSDLLFNLLGISLGSGLFFFLRKMKARPSLLESPPLLQGRRTA